MPHLLLLLGSMQLGNLEGVEYLWLQALRRGDSALHLLNAAPLNGEIARKVLMGPVQLERDGQNSKRQGQGFARPPASPSLVGCLGCSYPPRCPPLRPMHPVPPHTPPSAWLSMCR